MLDRARLLAETRAHGAVARVVVAEVKGSAPREPGAAVHVWASGQSGTIGGGALEHQAVLAARAALAAGDLAPMLHRQALGPDLGQCCGGQVTLLREVFTAESAALLPQTLYARPLSPSAAEAPWAIRRALAAARRGEGAPPILLAQGWLLEPIAAPSQRLWVWGAGHVGRALVPLMAGLEDWSVTWADVAEGRFPANVPQNVRCCAAPDLAALARSEAAPGDSHVILTFSHALDLALCDALLARSFATLGLIGSASKWARFQSRLIALGHAPAAIARIRCPIGEPALGKSPQAIAIGVAAAFLRERAGQKALGAGGARVLGA